MLRRMLAALTGSLLAGSACDPNELPPTPGRVADVAAYLQRLAISGNDAFLVIQVAASEAFLQVKLTPHGFELDHPLVTKEQQLRELAFRSFCERRELPLRETRGSEGSRFLDCYLPADPESAASLVEAALADLFGVGAETELLFSGAAIKHVAA